jgi:hypothetical protein
MIATAMQQIPPNQPPKKGGRPSMRTPADPYASLFNTGKYPVVGDPAVATKRTERGIRIAGDVKRALFFGVILVFVAIVLYQFVSVTAL